MGAPKVKWTAEEEAALKAGIEKHGVGKWSMILKDPEFRNILKSRSNVDLKDKWRNLCAMASGAGSRTKIRHTHTAGAANTAEKDDGDVTSAVDHGKNVASSSKNVIIDPADEDAYQDNVGDMVEKDYAFGVNKDAVADASPFVRFDDLILEAIANSKKSRGFSQRSIARYIDRNYSATRELKRALPMNLQLLVEEKRIIKVGKHYRLVPQTASSDQGNATASAPKMDFAAASGSDIPPLMTRAQIEAELIEKMKGMTPQEAAAVAAEAVAQAEAAIALAEAAAKEAEEAEAAARNARMFAEASDPKSTYFGTFSKW